ncbi:hypothetical protein FE810_06460 [Thalassotalea litorea]|uniref:Uncharacterized protein n=1 Tax=Thalassotalea litorea TaxID=2020715 RepID=A0A5R9IWN0_9GAMM|nr:hypothetical protein [Thalassotalea litorea]TLU66328.1 hypothetical protein FE810_06460 [Thalassotalea litorea]
MHETESVDLGASGVPLCDFRMEPCRYNAEWGSAILSSSVQTITPEDVFNLNLQFSDAKNTEIKSAFLQGRDMYMGKIPLFFNSKQSYFTTEVLIGACTESQMVWRMTVIVNVNQEVKTLHFDFVSYQ